MTVRAYEFAFGDFFEDEFRAPLPHLVANLAELDGAWQVIPLHALGRERTAAISPRPSGLHLT